MSKIKALDYRVLAIAFSICLFSAPIYYLLGRYSKLSSSIYTIFMFSFVAMIYALFGYELFFSTQNYSIRKKAFIVESKIDHAIPFLPQWVWIYGLVYYFLLFLPISVIIDYRELIIFLGGGIIIFLLSAPVFIFFPTSCPAHWRDFSVNNSSTEFLRFIQTFDRGRSCIPSLHCALSAYSSVFLHHWLMQITVPFVIAISCVLVKQHSILDIPGSIVFGWLVGFVMNLLF
jgi:hypothetical protein